MREQTILSRESISRNGTYLDWDTQPSLFKHYPEFCYRLSLSKFPQLGWLRSLRCITDFKYVASKPYYRLNVPSAGNLHPIELYVQIRNLNDVLSGIYHVDILREELVLIEEIGSQGLEPYVGLEHRLSGFILLFSIVPFRSSWKYGLRAWRYCYLDLGHQLGVLYALMNDCDLHPTKLSDIDAKGLNTVMGLGEEESVAAAFAFGEETIKSVKPMNDPLMRVASTDYTRRNSKLVENILSQNVYTDRYPLDSELWNETMNRSRRSARKFHPYPLPDDRVKPFFRLSCEESLDIVFVVLQAQSMQCGVYRNQECIQEGQFVSEMVALLLDQRFIQNASMVALIFSEHFDSKSHIEAGIYAQQLYLLSESFGIGCSGIGAFYDDEAARWNTNHLVHAVAIGGKKDE